MIRSHMCDKAIQKVSAELKMQIKNIARPASVKDEAKEVSLYNTMVMGTHNYYCIATKTALDFRKIARSVNFVLQNRLQDRLKKRGTLTGFKVIRDRYGQSRQMRYVHDMPIAPVGYVQHRFPFFKTRSINMYTEEGRTEIHKKLGVKTSILLSLMRMGDTERSIEYMDNRLSLYAAQNGKCAVTGKVLEIGEIHCHHITPRKFGGDDRYGNLVIVHADIHRLIHATNPAIIEKRLADFSLKLC